MINSCVFAGRLAKDPELKQTQSGVSYAQFTLAVERNYAVEGKDRETDFIDCRAWRGTADFIGKWFHKGSWIGVEGEMQTNMYEAQDGSKRKSVYCQVRQASFVGSREKAEDSQVAPEGFTRLPDNVPF